MSSEPERKEPGYHLPLQPLPEEQDDSQAAGAKATAALAPGPGPLTPSVFSRHSAGSPNPLLTPVFCPFPSVLPCTHFPGAFPRPPSLQHLLSWPLFFLLSVPVCHVEGKLPKRPTLSTSFRGKDWPQETNTSSRPLETSRLVFPSQKQNTKGC